MTGEAILEDLKNAILRIDEAEAVRSAKDSVAQGVDPLTAIEEGLSVGMKTIGQMFEKMEIFLPELIGAAKAFEAAMAVLEPEIVRRESGRSKTGILVLGTVKGDIHKIGKDIFALLMKTRGFEVHDLGEDVSVSTFVEMAEKHRADIIGLSALLNTTMPGQQDVIELLKEKGVRDKYVVMVGGAPVTSEWANEIGADACAETAEDGVRLALELIATRK